MEHPAADPANPAVPVEPAVPAEPGTPVTVDPAPPTPSYAIGGTLTGLAGSTKLVLLDNGGDALTLAANGAFSFAAPIAFNTAYTVTVGTQPLWQTCLVSNGSGTATADVSSVQVNCAAVQQAQVSTLAGSATRGSADGTGTAASFNTLIAVAVDANGNIYVADGSNNMIRKISPAGAVTTLAGSTTPGSADGTGTAAQFNLPSGVAVDAGGNVYVGDFGNNLLRRITPEGVVTTLAGSATPGLVDGTGANARFNGLGNLDIDASGNVYALDIYNNAVRKITPEGVVTTLAGSTQGSADGQGTAASFNNPNGIRLDSRGNIYIADSDNNMIRKITPSGAVTTLAGSTAPGFADGTGAAARFDSPWGIGVDASGNVYVADHRNNAIRKITPEGVVTTLAGARTAGSADGIGAAAQFSILYDVTADLTGNLYVIEDLRIRKMVPVR
jgi:sugar lactone lactonase YvrE